MYIYIYMCDVCVCVRLVGLEYQVICIDLYTELLAELFGHPEDGIPQHEPSQLMSTLR